MKRAARLSIEKAESGWGYIMVCRTCASSCHLRMTENKRLEMAAPAMKQRIMTRNNLLVLSELNLSERSWASAVMLATTAGNGCPEDE